MSDYRLWVNEERTVLVRLWADGPMEVATREDPSHTWGPPMDLRPPANWELSAWEMDVTDRRVS